MHGEVLPNVSANRTVMMLVQGDIKYGPKLPIGKNGARIQTYLSSAFDDHSRLLLASVSMAARRKPLLRIRSVRRSSDTESLMPATLITVPSISPEDQALSFKTGDPGSPCKTAERQKQRLCKDFIYVKKCGLSPVFTRN